MSLIEPDLIADTLVLLAIPDHPDGIYVFAGVWRRDTPPDPAASCLLDQFLTIGRGDVEEGGFGVI